MKIHDYPFYFRVRPGVPVDWSDINEPISKYQYASFVGLWASISNENECENVFPSCPFQVEDVTKALDTPPDTCFGGPEFLQNSLNLATLELPSL